MTKYLLVKFEGISELTEITSEELEDIRPLITAVLNNRQSPEEYDDFALFGHVSGYDKFMEFAPMGENTIRLITDIELLSLREVLM